MQPTKWMVTGGSGFIGTNLLELLLEQGNDVINIDIRPPQLSKLIEHSKELDICHRSALFDAVDEYKPDIIVHLAAKADFDPDLAVFRRTNVEGTKNVLDAAQHARVPRVILASTQYVNGPGTPFDDDLNFHPVNAYGQSKVEMEKLIRGIEYSGLEWVLLRPTNVWGPYHPRFPKQLWRYLRAGLYIHPTGAPIIRAYGYVKNVTKQIVILGKAPGEEVKHRVFYVGDAPIDSGVILNAFSERLRGRQLRRVPRWVLRLAALCGDFSCRVGIPAPITSDRYHRMTSDHLSRNETIWTSYAYDPTALTQAVDETAAWLRATYPKLYGP